jgi:hypothetical protein
VKDNLGKIAPLCPLTFQCGNSLPILRLESTDVLNVDWIVQFRVLPTVKV